MGSRIGRCRETNLRVRFPSFMHPGMSGRFSSVMPPGMSGSPVEREHGGRVPVPRSALSPASAVRLSMYSLYTCCYRVPSHSLAHTNRGRLKMICRRSSAGPWAVPRAVAFAGPAWLRTRTFRGGSARAACSCCACCSRPTAYEVTPTQKKPPEEGKKKTWRFRWFP